MRVFPVLESAIKAFACKAILFWLAAATYECTTAASSTHDKVRATCAYALASFLHCQDVGGVWLDKEESHAAQHHGRTALLSYGWLAREAFQQRKCRWKIRPKWRYLIHAVKQMGTFENLPGHACCQEEDLMGKIGRVCGKTRKNTMPLPRLQRYRLLLAVKWLKRRRANGAPGRPQRRRGPERGSRAGAGCRAQPCMGVVRRARARTCAGVRVHGPLCLRVRVCVCVRVG